MPCIVSTTVEHIEFDLTTDSILPDVKCDTTNSTTGCDNVEFEISVDEILINNIEDGISYTITEKCH